MEKRNTIKKIIIWILILAVVTTPIYFIFVAIGNCADNSNPVYTTKQITQTEPRVYVTKTGDCYHSSSCGYLHSSRIAIGLYEAKNSGYRACSVCHGRSSGTIECSYTTKVVVPRSEKPGFIILYLVCSIILAAIVIFLVYGWWTSRKEKMAESVINDNNDNATTSKLPIIPFEIKVNDEIYHKTFGKGLVYAIYNDYIEINFDCGIKKFKYPDSLGVFLFNNESDIK